MYGNHEYGVLPYGDSFVTTTVIIVTPGIAITFVSQRKMLSFFSQEKQDVFFSQEKQDVFFSQKKQDVFFSVGPPLRN